MKIKSGLTLRKIGKNHMIVDLVSGNANLTKVYTLNSTSADLWENFYGKDFTKNDLVQYLCEEYEVSEQQASEDTDRLLHDWSTMGLTE